MKNTNKNLIFGLGISLTILAILALGNLFMPTKAHATSGSVKWCSNCLILPEKDYTTPVYQPVYQTQPVVYQTQPVYQNNYQTNPPQANTTSSNSTVSGNTETESSEYSDLAANAVFGSNSFRPSGLIQWVVLAIIILLLVILVRKATGKDKKYHSEPLKFA